MGKHLLAFILCFYFPQWGEKPPELANEESEVVFYLFKSKQRKKCSQLTPSEQKFGNEEEGGLSGAFWIY